MSLPPSAYVPNRPHQRNVPNAPNLRLYDAPMVQGVPHIPPASKYAARDDDAVRAHADPLDLLSAPDMNRIARPVTVLVDSRDRDYRAHPHPHKYSIRLPRTLRNVTHARLVTCEMPASFYVFQKAHGTTGVRAIVDGVAQDVYVPDGNYSFATMSETLERALEEAFPDRAFEVRFDKVTQTCSIRATVDGTPVDSFSLDTTDDARAATSQPSNRSKETGWGLAYYLGFERDRVHEADQGTVRGQRPAHVFPEPYILLDIRGLGKVQEAGVFGERESRHTFAKIPINAPWPYASSDAPTHGESTPVAFPSVFWDKQITTNTILPPILALDVLHIEFRFHDRTPVDFHAFEHAMTLEFLASDVQTH